MMRKAMTLVGTGAAAVAMLLSSTGVATAANPTYPNANYGFDGNAHLIVGAGSTTLFKMAQSLATLWQDTASCATNNSVYNAAGSSPVSYPQSSTTPAFNQCTGTSQTYGAGLAGGNFDGDTVAIAGAAGSSTGLASLNGSHSGNSATYAYEGVNATIPTTGDPNAQNGLSNGYGTPDFVLSSRAAKTSGGNCPIANPTSGKAGDELQCDTFWGVASDGVDVFTFNGSSGEYDNLDPGGFSAQDLYNIDTCVDTTWGQLPEWQAANSAYGSANGGAADPNLPTANAPIVSYSMNSNSGTYGDYDNYINANVSAAGGTFALDNYSCNRELSGGVTPLENDVKPLIVDANTNSFTPPAYPSGTTSPYPAGTTYPAGISTSATSPQNPLNWIWFGSYGLLSEFPYLSNNPTATSSLPAFTTGPLAIAVPGSTDGDVPSPNNISAGTYPIERILSFVTKKADADCPITSGVCNFTANPGPTNGAGVTDLNVTGATSGKGGATREFIRFLCRKGATAQPTDPYTGVNLSSEITQAVNGSGFSIIPVSDRSSGSSCDVQSNG
jgi:hypothetical protein